jgi:hypothetical protein
MATEKKKNHKSLAVATRDAFVACRKDDAVRLEKALDSGVEPNARDENGLTLLMWAARKDSRRCASVLIGRNANIDHADAVCRSALHHAAMLGNASLARLLIEAGANLRHRDEWGQSALSASRGSFDPETYRVIRGAMVDAGVVLDEDESHVMHLKDYREILLSQPRGVRESDLPPNEALELQRFRVSPPFRAVTDEC